MADRAKGEWPAAGGRRGAFGLALQEPVQSLAAGVGGAPGFTSKTKANSRRMKRPYRTVLRVLKLFRQGPEIRRWFSGRSGCKDRSRPGLQQALKDLPRTAAKPAAKPAAK